jgi:deoxyadenosine/deoxycytidine kinase
MGTKNFVALAGNIGAGKSTAAKLIARHFGFELFHEPVVENRFLIDYYADMTRWSFTLQMEFLLKRVEHQTHIEGLPGGCVQDRTLIEDPEIFAKYLHGLGHMTDSELNLYFDYFQRFHGAGKQPNKIILLHTPDVNVLLRRIAERGRSAEKGITAEFLRGLNAYYDVFDQVIRRKYDLDVLRVDVTHRDFRQGNERDKFLAEIEDFLSEADEHAGQLPFATEMIPSGGVGELDPLYDHRVE